MATRVYRESENSTPHHFPAPHRRLRVAIIFQDQRGSERAERGDGFVKKDWCENHETLSPILEAALGYAKSSEDQHLEVLDVGCGTSTLPWALWNQGQRRVHAIDIDAAVIKSQQSLHNEEGLFFVEADITRQSLGEERFDFAVDKGTMDYLLCGELSAALQALSTVRRSLRRGGVLLLISIHPVSLWQAILKALKGHISFIELDSWSVPASTGDDRTAALALRRLDDVDDQMNGAQEAVARVMDQHFTTEAPLLTAERLDALREVWGEAEAKKTVEEAHVLLFPSAAEQAEYPMELFLEDLAEFLQTDPSKATLSLVDAEKFLGENQ